MSDSVRHKIGAWKDPGVVIVPALNDDVLKSARKLVGDPAHAPKSYLEDPFSLQSSMGFKDRKYSITYDTLKMMAHRVAVVNAIIQTRINQIAAFASPYRLSKSVGFVVKHKNPAHLTTKGEREMIMKLESFVFNCGHDTPNPHSDVKRDNFDQFLRKVTRDTLTMDQLCAEVVPDRRNVPYEFLAVDASTIRIASAQTNYSVDSNRALDGVFDSGPYRTLATGTQKKDVSYVQIVQGQIRTTYSKDEMLFGVRNPRTDIYQAGYGYSELEQLVAVITGYLNAETYNGKYFSNGSSSKGILNIKGDQFSADELEGFKRAWRANVEGVEAAFRTPIFQSENGIEWIPLTQSNKDMEFSQWMEFITKLICSVYLVDPAEIGMPNQGGVSQTPLFESSSEWKLKASRDKGLKPLLKFLAQLINQIIQRIDDHFVFDFAGLEELTELEKHELRKEQMATYMTLNEIRREDDKPDLKYGDAPMNPVYLQRMQMAQTQEQQLRDAKSAKEQSAPPGAPAAGAPPAVADASEDDEDDDYAESFGKSVRLAAGDRYVEFEFDEWIIDNTSDF